MFNELEDLNNLDSIKEMTNFLNNNMEELNKLNINQKQQIVDLFLDKTMYKIQIECLNSELARVLNTGLDIGLKIILPDCIDDQIIEIKNNILNYGFSEGLDKSFNNILQFGEEKNNKLINNFDNILDIQNEIKKDKVIEKISESLNKGINTLKDNKKINSEISNKIKKEKNTITKNIEENIEKFFENQVEDFKKMDSYISNWKEAYNMQDYNLMKKEYKKMEKIIDNLIPMEKTLNEYRIIENIQSLIKNNNNKNNLTSEALELANKLVY